MSIEKTLLPCAFAKSSLSIERVNPFHAEAIFIHGRKMQKVLKNNQTLLCWYSLESSCQELSNEHPFVKVLVIVQVFLHCVVLAKLATSSIRVNGNSLLGFVLINLFMPGNIALGI